MAGSNVHVASTDPRKAFEKVNYNLLYEKLCKTRLPKIIIRFAYYILLNTFVSVKYGGSMSEAWKVGNGLRQGSNWSPFCTIYIIIML